MRIRNYQLLQNMEMLNETDRKRQTGEVGNNGRGINSTDSNVPEHFIW